MANNRTPPKGKNWREDWRLYGVLVTSQSQRKALKARGRLNCYVCGSECTERYDAEHRFPLWLVDRTDYPNCLHRWADGNLEPICPDCHKAKTAKEAAARAKTKRLIAKQHKIKATPTEWQIKARQRQKEYAAQQRERIKAMKGKKRNGH